VTGEQTAILIVNGSTDPKEGRWLELCVEKIREHTNEPDYRLYVWNNNVGDPWVEKFLSAFSNVTLLQADPQEALAHPHAIPLQRLYERARQDRAKYIVTLDNDAHPVRDGWLAQLIAALDQATVIAAVWREELSQPDRPPFAHPSCLCTTTDFIERLRLRFDTLHGRDEDPTKYDTLSHFTDATLANGLAIHKLRRSNRNNLHRVLGGLYGDLVYHHGAGSREPVRFRGDPRSPILKRQYRATRELAGTMLYRHYERYLAWLQGRDILSAQPWNSPRVNALLVLGMHRSGTSCLTGCLERSGLHLGEVMRFNKFNVMGNHEPPEVVSVHDRLLAFNGGSWANVPSTITIPDAESQALRQIARRMAAHAPWGLKDPRLLLFAEAWRDIAAPCAFVGTFRHPAAVARSLSRRNKMPPQESHALWLRYNTELVHLHKRYQFPLIEFALDDVVAYCETVAAVAIGFGLNPQMDRLREFVGQSLDHYRYADDPVPDSCRETFNYLRAARFTLPLSTDRFERLLLSTSWWRGDGRDGALVRLEGKVYGLARRHFPPALVNLGRFVLSAKGGRRVRP